MNVEQIESSPVCVDANRIVEVADELRRRYREENGRDYPEWAVVAAIRRWLDREVDRISEDLTELLGEPHRAEAQRFRRQLERVMESGVLLRNEEAAEELMEDEPLVADAFSGHRVFSFEKLAALIAYIGAHAEDLYKTKLNKLLFYADFVHFYLHGTSISGSRYLHLPHGPVPERYETILATLADAGVVGIQKGQGYEIVVSEDDVFPGKLSREESATVDWVLENFGRMTTAQIREFSHAEKAYKYTRLGEPIAYQYAHHLKRLPLVAP
jgi:uncharacterized phage-associated protein